MADTEQKLQSQEPQDRPSQDQEQQRKELQSRPQKQTSQPLRVTAVQALNPRSLRLEFNNGAIRLFDSHRLRGPMYIPLMNEEIFTKPIVTEDGELGWEDLDITCKAKYIFDRSVPYDDNATAKVYVKTRRDIIQERIAIVLFPLMAIAGIIGTVYWWINN